MNLQTLEEICMSLQGTTQDIKWEVDLCFSVGGKMYCVAPTVPPFGASFKVLPEEFAELTQRQGIIPAPYMARNMWVSVREPNALSFKEWQYFVKQSYELIFKKLTRKQQKEILEAE